MSMTAPIYDQRDGVYRATCCGTLMTAVERKQLQMRAFARDPYPGWPIPQGILSGVKSVGFWDAAKDQDWGLDWHRDDGIEFCFMESGHLSFGADGQDQELRPNALTVTRPWQRHRIGAPHVTAGRLHWLILDVGVRRPNQRWHWPDWLVLAPDDIEELGDRLRQNDNLVWLAPAARECIRSISSAVANQQLSADASRLIILLNELLLLVLEVMREGHSPIDPAFSRSERTVELFLRDLAENPAICGREWTVCSMAAACGLGTTQFVKYCQQLSNVTPLHYLTRCRLAAAAEQLREEPDRNVTQVATACGFSSSQYFATKFQQFFGCSPSEYRNQHRSVSKLHPDNL